MKTLAILITALFLGQGESVTDIRTDSSSPAVSASGMMKSGSYNVNTSDSKVNWLGKKTGGQHNGTVSISRGSFDVEEGKMISGNFTIDMNSIVVEDIKNSAMNKRLTGHLKSDDFFSVEDHPKAFFSIKEGKYKEGAGGEAGYYHVKGTLTIKEISHDISFKAYVESGNNVRISTEDIVLDRTKWNVNHQSKSIFAELKDNYIYDEMTLSVDMTIE